MRVAQQQEDAHEVVNVDNDVLNCARELALRPWELELITILKDSEVAVSVERGARLTHRTTERDDPESVCVCERNDAELLEVEGEGDVLETHVSAMIECHFNSERRAGEEGE